MTALIWLPLALVVLVVVLGAVLVAVLRATRSELRDVASSITSLARAHERAFHSMAAVTKLALAGLAQSSPCDDSTS